jgi:hypothetical protein
VSFASGLVGVFAMGWSSWSAAGSGRVGLE